MKTNVSLTGGKKWQTIVVVLAILQKIEKEHQKLAVKAARQAAGILKMTRNVPQKRGKKEVKTVMAGIAAIMSSPTTLRTVD
ncbi:hypothetical protein FHW74_003787 [Atlantibacter sp. RC6]|nr:hypothetical protein [Atlantibacter sp. RC6]